MNTNFLFASLVWGSIGVGYFIYGRKQRSGIPMAGGVLIIGASYFAGSILSMSLICVCAIVLVHLLLRYGV